MSHIELKNVCKTYRLGANTVTALRGFSVEIESGEFAVILGPSGSGKTTFLNILGGLEQATSGEVHVDGKLISALPEAKLTDYHRRKVGFVFQFFNLLPTLSALENVMLTAEMNDGQDGDPKQYLERVGLGDRMDHYPGQLSGGQQQRVAVARALAKRPALVLADEPTGSLDIQTGIEVLDVMRTLNRETGQTFVLVTHNAVIAQMADRVVRVGNGEVHSVEKNTNPLEPRQLSW
ncbi:MAG TPA: ABC transporter ATP-binding protein [Anaerolineae bacterium]|nr:ABC transporter ATP-binding protein [Anaerolineae bacterium]